MFIIQHYLYKVPYLLQRAGLSAAEERRRLESLRPEPARRQYRHDLTEEDTAPMNDDYDETQSTTRASASASMSLKRKITEDTTETKKKQADIINNFHHVSITNFYSASASSTEGMKSTSKTDDSTTATPRAPKTSTP
eukprot:2995996-Amphidinium_carterae.1